VGKYFVVRFGCVLKLLLKNCHCLSIVWRLMRTVTRVHIEWDSVFRDQFLISLSAETGRLF